MSYGPLTSSYSGSQSDRSSPSVSPLAHSRCVSPRHLSRIDQSECQPLRWISGNTMLDKWTHLLYWLMCCIKAELFWHKAYSARSISSPNRLLFMSDVKTHQDVHSQVNFIFLKERQDVCFLAYRNIAIGSKFTNNL